MNAEDIEKYELTWIDNLKTSSGNDAIAPDYIRMYGRRKCESNALFKNDKTLEAAEEICRNAIEQFYGKDAKQRFTQKEDETKKKLTEIYDNPIWRDFQNNLDQLIESFAEKEVKQIKEAETYTREVELQTLVDNKYCGACPDCGFPFNYSSNDVGKLVRCKNCNAPMRLKLKDAVQPSSQYLLVSSIAPRF